MDVQEEGQKNVEGNALYTLLAAVKLAYRQYKSDLKYVKYNSNIKTCSRNVNTLFL